MKISSVLPLRSSISKELSCSFKVTFTLTSSSKGLVSKPASAFLAPYKLANFSNALQ